jgi:hypothetical protein
MISAIVVGMCWMVMTDQRLGGNNESRELAFYGAEAGMEKMTTDAATQFGQKGSLSAGDVASIEAQVPTLLTGIQYLNAAGASTYQMTFVPDANGNPKASNATILPPSPYAGMQGLITPFTLSVAAQNTASGSEVKLQRQIQLVAIPVFQFGIYSDSDLSFFNGPTFGFGGRTHTNGNLWLSPNAGPLYLGDKVTAVGEVIRTNLENGYTVNGSNYTGNVTIAVTPDPNLTNEPAGSPYTNATWLELGLTQGSTLSGTYSVYGAPSTTLNPNWYNIQPTIPSLYNGQLQNHVPTLSLTSTALGGITTPISLIRRAIPGEAGSNPAEFNEQYFSEATLRIMLDDYPVGVLPGSAAACHNSDMMSLGSDLVTTGTDPVDLALLAWAGPGADAAAPWYTGYPLPISVGTAAYSSTNGYWVQTNKPIITGCLKIEYQSLGGGWTDITQTIINQGISGPNINPQGASGYQLPPHIMSLPNGNSGSPTGQSAQGPTTNTNVTAQTGCYNAPFNPSPNAIIRLARVRDNPTTGPGCGLPSHLGEDYWPLALFDSREGVYRVALPSTPTSQDPGVPAPPGVTAAGVMNYVELDVKNLATWLSGNQGVLGLSNLDTGYTIYFSDRRGEQIDPFTTTKSGSFGFNDFANVSNPASGCPDGVLDPGENLEGDLDGAPRTYGGIAVTPANFVTGVALLGSSGLLNPNCGSTNWPGVIYSHTQEARENSTVYFRHALKLVDGATLNLGATCGPIPCGLTIASENPVYIQGDYNAPPTGVFTGASVAAAVAADSVTLLSDNWNDVNSFIYPYALGTGGARQAVQSAYRVALIAGKGIPFPQIPGACSCDDFGTDGGVHNFLRYLETWSGVNAYYYGSMVSFYFNRQGVGTYKNSGYVYSPPNRHYQFDTNFSQGPAYLPPRTPVLRSVNTIGFSQQLLPTQ